MKLTFGSMTPNPLPWTIDQTNDEREVEDQRNEFDPGKMSSSVTDGVLTIQRRTWRSGDGVHVVFSFLILVFGLLTLQVSIANGTLFDGVVTPVLILASLGYGYFGLTRITNRRTVMVTADRITAKDGPLPLFVRTADTDIESYGKVEVRSAMRFTFPPTSKYRLYYVGGQIAPDLFRRLPSENEANYAVARIRAFTKPSV